MYFQAAVGTEAYHLVEEMLSFQVFGWAAGQTGALKGLARATARVHKLIAEHSSDHAES